MLKNILIGFLMTMTAVSFSVSAEEAATTPEAKPAAPKTAQTKTVSVAEAMQLSAGQKTALQKLQQQRADHMKQMQLKYNDLQMLSEAEKLDSDKVEEVTDAMVDMVRKFSDSSTKANHDFYSSLSADQKKRMEAIAKQLKQRQQQATTKKPK